MNSIWFQLFDSWTAFLLNMEQTKFVIWSPDILVGTEPIQSYWQFSQSRGPLYRALLCKSISNSYVKKHFRNTSLGSFKSTIGSKKKLSPLTVSNFWDRWVGSANNFNKCRKGIGENGVMLNIKSTFRELLEGGFLLITS